MHDLKSTHIVLLPPGSQTNTHVLYQKCVEVTSQVDSCSELTNKITVLLTTMTIILLYVHRFKGHQWVVFNVSFVIHSRNIQEWKCVHQYLTKCEYQDVTTNHKCR